MEDESAEVVDPLGPTDVATINGERLPESIFRLYTLNALQVEPEALTPEGHEEVLEQLVLLTLLADDAENNGLHEERRIAAELELLRVQLLARAMAARYTEENPPTETELRDLYQENLANLRQTQYKTRHILVDTEEAAASLIDELNQGADFAELAQQHGTDSTSEDGGDLDWITPDSVVEPFAAAIQAATPGEPVSTPVETQFGWHVILVEEVEEGVAPGLEAVRQDLVVAVESRKLDEYVQALREGAEVTFVE